MNSASGIIITGAAKRVGAALALHFAKAGHPIALHYNHSENEARALQKDIQALGVGCEMFAHDMRDIAGLPGLMTKIKDAMPDCATLINNASFFARATLMETDEALFNRQLEVNFKAPFFMTQAFARVFGRGNVINMLDTDIVRTQGSHFVYLLSKKALAEFTQMAARELGPDIRVNGICPGLLLPSTQNDVDYERKLKSIIPLKSHPTLDDICGTARWLIAQPHVTGQFIYVDGGHHVI